MTTLHSDNAGQFLSLWCKIPLAAEALNFVADSAVEGKGARLSKIITDAG